MIVFAFIGCRVDSNVVSLSTKDLQNAIDGKVVNVSFKAEVTVPMDLEDKGENAQLDSIQKILENYLDTEDCDVDEGLLGAKIEIEGKIPLLRANRNDGVKVSEPSAWALGV